VRLLAGTSGFSYPEWKGSFYPADLADRGLLTFYAGRLPTVEINNTFYRMPRADVLGRWTEQVPEAFRFVLKAPQRITHRERLAGSADSVAYFWKNATALGERLGPVLFQLPPSFKRNVDLLRRFLGELPRGMRAAFELRHPSWAAPEVEEALREAGAAWCVADTDPAPRAPDRAAGGAAAPETSAPDTAMPVTADWGYLRLRRAAYSDAELAGWAERIRAQPWREAYVFFKHEEAGAAPQMALRMAGLLALAEAAAPAASEAAAPAPAAAPPESETTWR